jgi:hypothetical protein
MLRVWTSFDIQKMAGEKINGTANAILLRTDIHQLFEDFYVWLEPTVRISKSTYWDLTDFGFLKHNANEYRVRASLQMGFNDKLITLRDATCGAIALPDPEVLAIHAAFSQVFHASGAAEYIDKILDQAWDTTCVLSWDGAGDTGLLLSAASIPRAVSVW